MAVTHQYLQFYIYLSNAAQVAALQGSLVTTPGVVGNGVGAILMAPDDAAVTYAAPKLAAHAAVVAPGISSTWFGTEDHFPTNVATFDRKSGGWFGWSFLFGDTTHYHWRGIFVYVPPADPLGVPTAQTISPRRWVDGFEIMPGGEGGSIANAPPFSKEASRHVQGMGLMLRNSIGVRSHIPNELIGGALPSTSWERFYIRPRAYPATPATVWRAHATISVAAGCAIQLTATGQLAINAVDAAGALSFLAASSALLALDVWHRIDIHLAFGGGTSGTAQVWVDGTVIATVGVLPMGSVGMLHGSSDMGGGAANTMAIDVDDWMCADKPVTTDGIDFQSGSGMFLITPTALDAASSVNWTGDVRALQQNPATNANAAITSATAGAQLIANTDWHAVVRENPEAIGMVAMVACMKATGVQAANLLGFVGLDLAAPVSALGIALNGYLNFLWRVGIPTQALKPTNPINLSYTHGNAGATTINNFFAVVELIGIFGPEDAPHVTPAPTGLKPRQGSHNSPYPWTPWARTSTTPQQPVLVVTGTYVGTGTGIDLNFAVPVHFFRTRPLVAEAGGAMWWSCFNGARTSIDKGPKAHHLTYARIDPDFVPAGLDLQQQQTKLSIVGNDAQSNALGVTYAYVAICDPGMRFLINCHIKQSRGTIDMVTTLPRPAFTPLLGLFHFENLSGANVAGLLFKGPGHALQTVSQAGVGGDLTNALQFALGALTNRTTFNTFDQADDIACALFRTNDTTPAADGKVFQIFTYVGDGNASRTLACTPVSGKRPMWALVMAHTTAQAIFRDPSHTGVTSSLLNGAQVATTGITAGGIDSISVGILLNALNVVYEVLVIPGDTVAGNGGWSVAGTFMPVSPEAPTEDPGDPTAPQEEPDPPVADPAAPASPISDPLPPTGPMPSLTDDLAAACTTDTHRIANVALARIGVNKQIANIATDATREAVAMRLVYNDAVQQTLRDFPWPFATRYVQLAVLNASARPNTDWRYAYRQPNDCLFERRIVVSRTDVANPDGVPFQLSSDFDPGDAAAIPPVAASGGGIIFTNLVNAVLEYTARPKCPHTKSEPLFRDAVAWKLAEALAPSLSRMTEAAVMCAKAYQLAIDQAYLVLRPGNAGDVPAAATVDTSAAAIAANLSVANAALIQIGARTIRNLTSDQSREAQLMRVVFEQELRATLRDYPWPFATVYVTPALVGGTSTVPVNADWQYSYRLPTDYVFARRLVTSKRRAYDANPSTFKVAKDTTGDLLFTDVESTATEPLVLEYTKRPEGAVLVADPLFRDALAWRLSWRLAPSLALVLPERPEAVGRGPDDSAKETKERTATGASLRARAADKARQCYYFAIATAEVSAAREQQQDVTAVDASWITDRD